MKVLIAEIRRAAQIGFIIAASFLVLMCYWPVNVLAQTLPAPTPAPPPNPPQGGNIASFLLRDAPYQFWLTCIIGLFGLATIAALILSMSKIGSLKPEDVSRPLVIVIVIIAALILITAGYSTEQIAPAFGLFGSIVGYMFGRMGQNANVPTTLSQDDAPGNASQAAVEVGNASGRRAVTP
jgi:glycerol uptake facilitator-like aquaporin